MNVFVCEFITAGGLRGAPLPESLLKEGGLMRDRLMADVAELPGVGALLSVHDDRLPAPLEGSVPVGAADDPWAVWADVAARADIVWPVAPETDGLLSRLVRHLGQSGARLIACAPEAIDQVASKLNLARRLAAAGLPHIPTFARDALPDHLESPLVTKPDDGAGCENTRLWDGRAQLPPARDGERLIVQPFIAGTPASLTVLVRPDTVHLLAVNRQKLAKVDGALRFDGLTVGAFPDADGALARLARDVVAAFPGLAGLIGIDIILTAGGPVVVEVNPRVTTAYAGLHAALAVNPAAFLPQFIREGHLPALPHLPPASPVEVEVR